MLLVGLFYQVWKVFLRLLVYELIEEKTRSPARDGVAHALGKCPGNGGKIGSLELRVPIPHPDIF
jgi:hypothetical protein